VRTIHVIKLGGSLLDLPDLPARLTQFLDDCPERRHLLVVGGGRVADHVRAFDDLHGLDPREGHMAAVRAMQLNSVMVSHVLRAARLVAELRQAEDVWSAGGLPVVDPVAWLEREEAAGRQTPRRWSFTSDSIAAWIACSLSACRLTLLKSRLSASGDLAAATAGGVVDGDFEMACGELSRVSLVNLRQRPPGCLDLR
jgi:aspartokinase-like uncharacterized kinase